jgi:hypothetical protein
MTKRKSSRIDQNINGPLPTLNGVNDLKAALEKPSPYAPKLYGPPFVPTQALSFGRGPALNSEFGSYL